MYTYIIVHTRNTGGCLRVPCTKAESIAITLSAHHSISQTIGIFTCSFHHSMLGNISIFCPVNGRCTSNLLKFGYTTSRFLLWYPVRFHAHYLTCKCVMMIYLFLEIGQKLERMIKCLLFKWIKCFNILIGLLQLPSQDIQSGHGAFITMSDKTGDQLTRRTMVQAF